MMLAKKILRMEIPEKRIDEDQREGSLGSFI